MKVTLLVHRQASAGAAPFVDTFVVDCAPQATLLECLYVVVEEQDATLAVRDNCFAGVCGECGVRANGREVLACRMRVDGVGVDESGSRVVNVQPLRFHPLIRDLVVDRRAYFDRLLAADAVFRPRDDRPSATAGQVAALQRVTRCLHCGLCVSSCDAYVGQPQFVGPAALAWVKRFVDDPRDGATGRGTVAGSPAGTAGCLDCADCNAVCPEAVAPFDAIRALRTTP